MISRETEAKLKKGKKMNILIKKPDTVETFQKKITTAVVDVKNVYFFFNFILALSFRSQLFALTSTLILLSNLHTFF